MPIRALIITENYPPVNKTSAQRAAAWAEHFPENDITPTIVTIDYEANEHTVVIEQGVPIHRITSKKRFTQRYDKQGPKNFLYLATIVFRIIQKILFEYSPLADPYHALSNYLHENDLLKKHDVVIITGGPFIFFRIGYDIHRRLASPWIADYRDDWSTNEINIFYKSWIGKIIRWRERQLEKKWLPTASFFTTVSPYLRKRIQDKIAPLPGYNIENGYVIQEHLTAQNTAKKSPSDRIRIAYLGSILPSQSLHAAVKTIGSAAFNAQASITITFVGSPISSSRLQALKELVQPADVEIVVTPRINRLDALEILYNSDALLKLSYKNIKGIPASKLYEYLATDIPVFLFYDDGDIISNHLTASGQGYIFQDNQEAHQTLQEVFRHFSNTKRIPLPPQAEDFSKPDFSRKAQSKKMADLIKDFLNSDRK